MSFTEIEKQQIQAFAIENNINEQDYSEILKKAFDASEYDIIHIIIQKLNDNELNINIEALAIIIGNCYLLPLEILKTLIKNMEFIDSENSDILNHFPIIVYKVVSLYHSVNRIQQEHVQVMITSQSFMKGITPHSKCCLLPRALDNNVEMARILLGNAEFMKDITKEIMLSYEIHDGDGSTKKYIVKAIESVILLNKEFREYFDYFNKFDRLGGEVIFAFLHQCKYLKHDDIRDALQACNIIPNDKDKTLKELLVYYLKNDPTQLKEYEEILKANYIIEDAGCKKNSIKDIKSTNFVAKTWTINGPEFDITIPQEILRTIQKHIDGTELVEAGDFLTEVYRLKAEKSSYCSIL